MSAHFRPRYSARYSGRYCVNFGYARDRGKRVEGRGKRVEGEVPPLTRTPQGVLVSEPVPQLSLWLRDELNSESQPQNARATCLVVAS